MIRPCNLAVILMDITEDQEDIRYTVIRRIIRIMEALHRRTILGKTENILEIFTPPFRMLPAITITQDILTRLLFLGNDLIPMLCYTKAQRIRYKLSPIVRVLDFGSGLE